LSSEPRIGLALGSGSSRGWAHIGIINALKHHGIEPHVITGCSIGALVGASYATGKLPELESWVRSLTRFDVARFFEISTGLNGFVNKEHLHQFLNHYICSDDCRIEDLSKVFAAVSTDLATGTEIWFSKGSLIEAVWASISLPGLFPAIRHKNHWLVDGGLVNPVPISTCRAMGADIVIAVNLNGDIAGKHFRNIENEPVPDSVNRDVETGGWVEMIGRAVKEYSGSLFSNHKEDTDRAPGLFDAIAGSINITQDSITRFRIASDPPDILITPRLMQISPLEFYRGSEAITEGVAALDRMLPEIEGVIKSV
jgi:NTE family protein